MKESSEIILTSKVKSYEQLRTTDMKLTGNEYI
jgi:hypothetical protein